MSQENLELAEALLPDDTDVVWLIRDEDAFSQLSELIGPLSRAVGDIPKHYRGVDRRRRTRRGLARDHGRRKDMETEIELIGATTLTFREGKVARWGDYADRAEAFKAVGLSEQDAHADS